MMIMKTTTITKMTKKVAMKTTTKTTTKMTTKTNTMMTTYSIINYFVLPSVLISTHNQRLRGDFKSQITFICLFGCL